MGADLDAVAAGLRVWARGSYPLEAGVELLIRACGGRLLTGPWVTWDRAAGPARRAWIVPEEDAGAYLSGGERRLLAVALSLTGEDVNVCLSEVLPGLDREAVALVLAAVAHAAGSHEHSALIPAGPGVPARLVDEDGTRLAFQLLPSLHPWPLPPGDQPGEEPGDEPGDQWGDPWSESACGGCENDECDGCGYYPCCHTPTDQADQAGAGR